MKILCENAHTPYDPAFVLKLLELIFFFGDLSKSRPREALLATCDNAGGSWAASELSHPLSVTHYVYEFIIYK